MVKKNEHKKLSNKRNESKIKRENEKAKMTLDDDRQSQKKQNKWKHKTSENRQANCKGNERDAK